MSSFAHRVPRRAPSLAVLLVLAPVLCAGASPPYRHPPRNVILFLIDTLRADRLGVYGNGAADTPALDAFGRGGVVFERAFAPAPQTMPSHASLFTSTYPAVHGAWNEVSQPGRRMFPVLQPKHTTLAEVLKGAGWTTYATTDGGWLVPKRGLLQGFEQVQVAKFPNVTERVTRALTFLTRRDRSRPFFLFLQTYQVHAPYVPPRGYEDRFDPVYQGPFRSVLEAARTLRILGNELTAVHTVLFEPLLPRVTPADRAFLLSLYDAELALVDEQFARLMSHLTAARLLENTIVIVTSDHGEEFLEHAAWEHVQVFDETTHVPLMIQAPESPTNVRRRDAVDLVDVMPSLLAYLGVSAPPEVQGHVVGLTGGYDEGRRRTLIAEINEPEPQVAVRRRDMTVVLRRDDARFARVLRRSAGGEIDLSDTPRGARLAAWARRELAAHDDAADERHAGAPATMLTRPALGPEQERQLRALGYLE